MGGGGLDLSILTADANLSHNLCELIWLSLGGRYGTGRKTEQALEQELMFSFE